MVAKSGAGKSVAGDMDARIEVGEGTVGPGAGVDNSSGWQTWHRWRRCGALNLDIR